MTTPRLLLGLLGMLTIGLVWVDPWPQDMPVSLDIVEPVTRPSVEPPPVGRGQSTAVESTQHQLDASTASTDLFMSRMDYQSAQYAKSAVVVTKSSPVTLVAPVNLAETAVQSPPPEPKPEVRVIGTWMSEGGPPSVFLATPHGTTWVSQGRVIMGGLLVESIEANVLRLKNQASGTTWTYDILTPAVGGSAALPGGMQ